ncbi:MAG TPA: Ig-like domain-containing protein [Acidimicrobiales bacterium]|nr:Ig-like domain-containing protein [Acidimicrobiales bacterium]
MQALAAHSPPKRRRPWILAVVLVAVVAVGVGVAFAVTGGGSGGSGTGTDGGGSSGGGSQAGGGSDSGGSDGGDAKPLTVLSTTPTRGAKDVASNTTITVRFSAPLAKNGHHVPTLTPPVSGAWTLTSPTTLTFQPTAPFIPSVTETLTVPDGPSGIVGAHGQHLESSTPITFTIAVGSTTRLQQLLAQLGFMPLSYVEPDPAPAPQDMAMPQAGTMAWRWPGLPTQLTSLWTQGSPNMITKAAIETFESQNGLTVDGLAGPKVWTALLADVAAGKGDTTPWNYVLVTKTLPQHLTLWVDGSLKYGNIAVNTGAPGADTADGTFAVFEHVRASEMKGTNVTGSTYDDPTVPWASYFNGGDALHGFPRAHYGYPQSNGCVEMPITTAGKIWPYTPIGTLVTVQGPSS